MSLCGKIKSRRSLHLQVQIAERAREVSELKRNLAKAIRDKEQLQEVNEPVFVQQSQKCAKLEKSPPIVSYR